MIQELTVIGLMSGTSLDGLDVCCARFYASGSGYDFRILAAETFHYSKEWIADLSGAFHLNEDELQLLDLRYGKYTAQLVHLFILKNNLKGQVDLIGSHGQTIFHEPQKAITVQIGSGQSIADHLNIPVVNDFRIRDVKLGGEGAPLVPIGDKFLFHEYASCLNLGGIANISYEISNERIAFDICPANLPLNSLVGNAYDVGFDRNGQMAAAGETVQGLREEFNDLNYYRMNPPKSLGIEWVRSDFDPLLAKYNSKPTNNLLRTVVEHETDQIAMVLNEQNIANCLITGGGALNTFFIKRLRAKTRTELILPNVTMISFKESLIFGFMAFLSFNSQINILSSVTGAREDSIGGILHHPKS